MQSMKWCHTSHALHLSTLALWNNLTSETKRATTALSETLAGVSGVPSQAVFPPKHAALNSTAKHKHARPLPVIESRLDQRVAIEHCSRRFNEQRLDGPARRLGREQ